jgi:hypothetical protein
MPHQNRHTRHCCPKNPLAKFLGEVLIQMSQTNQPMQKDLCWKTMASGAQRTALIKGDADGQTFAMVARDTAPLMKRERPSLSTTAIPITNGWRAPAPP